MKNPTNALLGALILVAAGPRLYAPAPAAPAAAGNGTPISSLPFQASDPGYYYVTQDLTDSMDGNGIQILSPEVHIDLCGFTLRGTPDSSSAILDVVGRGARVTNGWIVGWPDEGLSLGADSVVTDVQVRDCGGIGIRVAERSRVERCTMTDNGDRGLQAGMRSVLRDSFVTAPTTAMSAVQMGPESLCEGVRVTGGSTGVSAGARSTVRDTTVADHGLRGIVLGAGGTAESCAVILGAQDVLGSVGISTFTDALVARCSVRGNATGISAFEGSSVVDCRVSGSGIGISVESYGRVTGCTAVECDRTGISGGRGTVVEDSIAALGGDQGLVTDGVLVQDGTVVRDVLCIDNTGMGIGSLGGGLTLWNASIGNGGDGLYAFGETGRVEGNTVDANGRGIVVDGTKHLVIGNRAADNAASDFVLPFGNPFGPTLNTKWAIQGSAPQANFRTP